ncbi:uncharacterized protein RCO7_11725 [Rhynchosporium graminicola]|uniref:Reverse transcriptase Ty1/copia-type domain-containing protein n=1 Tax=Rhynchosporium graminicola TaxID=2792576 RepID=A0A1E1LDI6_9HELO|nr:uncharacterized protein RCO7_11725 [Rhynchosporium commune]
MSYIKSTKTKPSRALYFKLEERINAFIATYGSTNLEEINEYTSVIQASSVYLKQLKCEIPKLILASLIFKGLLSSFDSFASRKGRIRKAHPELIPNKSTKKKSKGKGAKESKEESTKALMSSFSSTSSSILDSGASEHYTLNKSWLLDYKPVSKKSITIANSDILPIIGRGDILIITREGDRVLIKDVNYVPSLKTTLLSSKELTNKDWKVTFNKKGINISNSSINIEARWYYNAYYLEVDVNHELLEPVSFKVDSNKSSKLDLYYKPLFTKLISDTPPLTIFDIDIAGPFKIKVRVLGSLTYILINKRTNKFEDKYDRGILVRYKSANNFLVYIPKKRAIISSKNVLIKEYLTFKNKVISKEELESFNKTLNDCETSNYSNRVISLLINTPKSDISRAENSEKTNSKIANNLLNKEKVIEDIELDLFNDIAEEAPIVEIPKRAFISSKSDDEIRLSPDPERILIKKDPELKAINKEIASLENHNTWKVVDSNTKTIKLLKTRWVYKIKELESEYYEFKARFVAKGFK